MWTSYLHDLLPEEAVRAFASRGWKHLELSNEHGAALLERGDPAKVGERFRRFCEELGVNLPQGHLKLHADITPPSEQERHHEIEELKLWVELFGAVGVRAGVLHPGSSRDPARPADEVFAANVKSLTELVEHAAGGPTVLCLENGANAGRLVRLIRAVGGDGLAICFDTGHLGLARARGIEGAQTDYEFILEAGSYLKALHLADNDGSGDQHLLPFDGGTVDWDGVMRGLREIGYEELFNFEVPGECGCSIQQRLDKLDRAREIADRLLNGADDLSP